jgi:NADH-quinone oxidoreductase subunit N
MGAIAAWIPLERGAPLLLSSKPAQGGFALVAALAMVWGATQSLRAVSLRSLAGGLAIGQSGLLLLALLSSHQTQSGPAGTLSEDPRGAVGGLLLATVGALSLAALCAAIAVTERAGYADHLGRAGLSRRHPLLSAAIGLSLLSLAGAPPLIGFIVRMFVLQSAVVAGFTWLVLLALACGVVALVPVLRELGRLYVAPPGTGTERAPYESWTAGTLLTATCTLLVGLTVVTGPLASMAFGATVSAGP